MKGYTLLLLLSAVLMLLLPLPALPRSTPSQSPSPTTSTNQTKSPSEPPAPTQTDVFKILAGDTVIDLDCRDFLIRTLAFEMSPATHTEALKAQAVAAYTYYGRRRLAQKKQADPTLKGAHFKTPAASFPQEYTTDKLRAKWGSQFDTHYNKLAGAVDAVLGRHITYNGEWIDACYFAISHGSTESAETVWGSDIPYLRSVASPADKLTAEYEKTILLAPETVKKALLTVDNTLVLDNAPSDWFTQTEKTATGSLKTITVGGKPLAATAVRTALSLRSTHVAITFADGQFRFTTRGYGHGVGMSQNGADYLARQGLNWKEILQYYYTDVTIV